MTKPSITHLYLRSSLSSGIVGGSLGATEKAKASSFSSFSISYSTPDVWLQFQILKAWFYLRDRWKRDKESSFVYLLCFLHTEK